MNIKEIMASSLLPRRELEMLLAFILGQTREHLLTHPEETITPAQRRRFYVLAERRLAGEPIAYLNGEKEFYGLNFQVNHNVLVPRPETELIIDLVIDQIQEERLIPAKPLTIIDIGTGSGAIIITLAQEIKKQWPSLFADSHFYATDISAPALKIARKNARQQGLFTLTNGQRANQLKFYPGDLLEALTRSALFKSSRRKINPTEVIITANLPYLTPGQIKASPTIQAEPRLALDGGRDGLKYYRRLFRQIKSQSLFGTIYCEIDPTQVRLFKKSLLPILPSATSRVYQDLNRQNRLIRIQWPKPKNKTPVT